MPNYIVETRLDMIYAKLKSEEGLILLQDVLRTARDKNWYRRLQGLVGYAQ